MAPLAFDAGNELGVDMRPIALYSAFVMGGCFQVPSRAASFGQ